VPVFTVNVRFTNSNQIFLKNWPGRHRHIDFGVTTEAQVMKTTRISL